ncbi:MAG: chlorite dismutase family protein [Hyphomicrobiaceae bacterium]|nr:chlorite dismutase family protein [Hyphomicrobiaceae bacterium]
MHNLFAFVGSATGNWRVLSMSAARGTALDHADFISVKPIDRDAPIIDGAWLLLGQISNVRYATRAEITSLRASQAPLGREQARRAALIPIKKSPAWWDLAQDERRAIFEEQSQHTKLGLNYLPAVARQLYHCRDLAQPFDFLTWFEYAPENADAFEDLVARLRATTEWQYVEREIDVRLELYQ